MEIKCNNCGCKEFVTQPNRYDIYGVIGNKLVLSESPFIEKKIKLFCRECSKELQNAVDLISE